MKHIDFIRSYRSRPPKEGEKNFQVLVEESDLWISCPDNAPEDLPAQIVDFVGGLRAQIKSWSIRHPEFLTSLTPVEVSDDAPHIIKHMADGARLLNVGPMAAVAGAIAEAVVREFASRIATKDFLVENGGDIYMFSTRDRVIALLPDPETGNMIGLKLKKELFPLSVCSSSATIGHSLSFGNGELATVIAKDGAYADAAATACCNMLLTPSDVNKVMQFASSHKDILGIFAQCGDKMGLWGGVELTVIN